MSKFSASLCSIWLVAVASSNDENEAEEDNESGDNPVSGVSGGVQSWTVELDLAGIATGLERSL